MPGDSHSPTRVTSEEGERSAASVVVDVVGVEAVGQEI